MIQVNTEETQTDITEGELNSPLCYEPPRQDENNLPHHLIPIEFIRVFAWMITLVIGFGLGRLLCIGHGDFEYCRQQLQHEVFDNLSALLAMGVTLFYFTGLNSASRFNYLFGFGADTRYSGLLFIFTFIVVPIVWKGIDTTALQTFAFTAQGLRGAAAPLVAIALACIFTVGWHIVLARRHGVLRVYVASRLLVYGFFLLYIVVCVNEPHVEYHVHHYQLGWLVALLGCFNDPISLVTLTFGVGLFIEGIATYGADPMFYPDE